MFHGGRAVDYVLVVIDEHFAILEHADVFQLSPAQTSRKVVPLRRDHHASVHDDAIAHAVQSAGIT